MSRHFDLVNKKLKENDHIITKDKIIEHNRLEICTVSICSMVLLGVIDCLIIDVFHYRFQSIKLPFNREQPLYFSQDYKKVLNPNIKTIFQM